MNLLEKLYAMSSAYMLVREMNIGIVVA